MTIPITHIGKGGLTGKTDSTGTEIQDGDVLEYKSKEYPYHPSPYTVRWSDGNAGFICEDEDHYILPKNWPKMRIIGNVYTDGEV